MKSSPVHTSAMTIFIITNTDNMNKYYCKNL